APPGEGHRIGPPSRCTVGHGRLLKPVGHGLSSALIGAAAGPCHGLAVPKLGPYSADISHAQARSSDAGVALAGSNDLAYCLGHGTAFRQCARRAVDTDNAAIKIAPFGQLQGNSPLQ